MNDAIKNLNEEPHRTTIHGGIGGYAECACGWRSLCTIVGDPKSFATWHRVAIAETIANPYLLKFLEPITDTEREIFGIFEDPVVDFFVPRVRRERLIVEYAHAIPAESVVRKLAELSPICELGCGTGYWAKLLADVGADVLAVDSHPPLEGENSWHRASRAGLLSQPAILQHFVDIVKADATLFDVPSDHALMLCWPPDDDMAARVLSRYRGEHVIYIGEGGSGCTGDYAFHTALAEQWKMTASYAIPQWEGLRDDVSVYARSKS
jgi:hypothetical protein